MTSEPRVVVDTNVLVSAALLPQSAPRQAVDLASQNGRLLFSEATFTELDDVLRRSKFDRYVSEQTRLEFLVSLVTAAEIVPISVEIIDCRDPQDNKILELAVSGNASDIVSGDADLLVLNPFRGIDILTVDAFLLKWTA
jgi:uncharacterized protein